MSDATTASPALVPFTARHEGRVHKAYRDAGGVITIGNGFTGLSTVFSAWWKAHRGHALRMGDTIADAECDLLLDLLLGAEYAPPVAGKFAGTGIRQNEFDAATDMVFNCGAEALKWQWAAALAERLVAAAADKLRVTAVTARGRRLTGLARRRADEARLMETGDYGDATATPAVSTSREDVAAYQQQLGALGLYKGAVDGIAGRKTLAAVRAFQQAQGLIVDGIVGPATRAALARAVAARRAGQAAGGGAATGATVGGGVEAQGQASQVDWSTVVAALEWGLAILAVIVVASLVWRYRGVILKRRTAA